MYGFGIGNLRRADHCRNIQIALGKLRRANADRLVRKTYGQRVAIRFAVDSHGAYAQLFASANDTQGNLATIGNQNLLKHFVTSVPSSYASGTAGHKNARSPRA